jgi:hypothetical protein
VIGLGQRFTVGAMQPAVQQALKFDTRGANEKKSKKHNLPY